MKILFSTLMIFSLTSMAADTFCNVSISDRENIIKNTGFVLDNYKYINSKIDIENKNLWVGVLEANKGLKLEVYIGENNKNVVYSKIVNQLINIDENYSIEYEYLPESKSYSNQYNGKMNYTVNIECKSTTKL